MQRLRPRVRLLTMEEKRIGLRLRWGIATVMLLVALEPASALGHPASGFIRLGSDPAEGRLGADLLYLDVAQRGDSLVARFGLAPDVVARSTADAALVVWNFSLAEGTRWQTYAVEARLGSETYNLLDTTDDDSDECEVDMGALAGSFNRDLGVITIKIPLNRLRLESSATLAAEIDNMCYSNLPEIRSYFDLPQNRIRQPFSMQADHFRIQRSFRIRV